LESKVDELRKAVDRLSAENSSLRDELSELKKRAEIQPTAGAEQPRPDRGAAAKWQNGGGAKAGKGNFSAEGGESWRNKPNRQNDVCRKCKQKGHWARDCRVDSPPEGDSRNRVVRCSLATGVEYPASDSVGGSVVEAPGVPDGDLDDAEPNAAVSAIGARNVMGEAEAELLSKESLRAEQQRDQDLSQVMDWKTAGERPTWSAVTGQSVVVKNLWTQWESLELSDGVLYRRFEDVQRNTSHLQLIVPRKLQEAFVRQCHEGMTGGHLGRYKTEIQVSRRAYFQGWRAVVQRVCRTCQACNRYHRGDAPRQGAMQIHEAGNPMERLAIDLTGQHPKSSGGHVYVLTVVDVFSRFLIAVPLRDKTARAVADALFKHVFCKFGTCQEILSDQGTEFNNSMMEQMCELFGIRKLRTTGYRASANGRIERIHRTINSIIGKMVAENHRNWHEILDLVVAAYNASGHESTNYSPNLLMFGRETSMPLDLIVDAPAELKAGTTDDYVRQLQEKLEKAYSIVRVNTRAAAERQKRYYDSSVRGAQFAPEQFVWVYYPRRRRGRYPKWSSYYVGPCRVERRINDVNYVVRRTPRSKPWVVHVDKMKSYEGDVPDCWHRESDDGESRDAEEVAALGDDGVEGQGRPRRVVRRPVRFED
jgi:transposase InsO family protein